MFKLTLIQSQSDRMSNIKVLVFRDTNIWSTKLTRGSTSSLKTPYLPLPYLEPTLPFFKNFPSLPHQFSRLLSNLVVTQRRQSENMKKPTDGRTKDLNIKDRANLKKKHNCNQCNYSTARLSSLKSHKLIHSGEKPFACSQCKYSCTTAGNLKRHLLIHSGENPFKCRQCNYSCKTAGNLKLTLGHT